MRASIRAIFSSTLIVCILTMNVPTANAGKITGRSLQGTTATAQQVLQYIAQNVDHNVVVTSAYRNPQHNQRVGGASGSQHMQGKAFDLSMAGLSDNQKVKLVRVILAHPAVQGFGYYNTNSIHFDVRSSGRAYWGPGFRKAGFDALYRAQQIKPMIIGGLVYEWYKTGKISGTGDIAPLQNITPPPTGGGSGIPPNTPPTGGGSGNTGGQVPPTYEQQYQCLTQGRCSNVPGATAPTGDIYSGFNVPDTVTTCTNGMCVTQSLPQQNLGGTPPSMYSPNASAQGQNPYGQNNQPPTTQKQQQPGSITNPINQNTSAAQLNKQLMTQQTSSGNVSRTDLTKQQQDLKQKQEVVKQQLQKLLQQLLLISANHEHDDEHNDDDTASDITGKALEELTKQQKELLLKQLGLLTQPGDGPNTISGSRAVTVVAAPNMDYWGVMLTDLVQKLRAAGQDVIVLPDSENYQAQIDKAINQIKTLNQSTPVNCVGWSKGALGCIALSKQLNTAGIKMREVILIAPTHTVDSTSVPGVSLDEARNNAIELDVMGKVTMYISTDQSAEDIDHLKKLIKADETKTVTSSHGQVSLGLETSVHQEIITSLSAGARGLAATGVGTVYNVNLAADTQTSSRSNQSTLIQNLANLSPQSSTVPNPLSLLNNLGQRISNLFAIDRSSRLPFVYDLDKDTYLLLVQELVADTQADTSMSSDLTTAALRASNTLGKEYRFRGSVSRTLAKDQGATAFSGMDSYFGSNVEHELLLDLQCDGTVDSASTFQTPYYSILPRTDGADVLLSEYMEIPEEGLHCFAFNVDVGNTIPETDENNNQSTWREFIAGFGGTSSSSIAELPPLNFEVSAYTDSYGTITQDWTNQNISVSPNHEVAFRWNAAQYQKCIPLLSSLTPGVAENQTPIERNTLSENIDLDERTGYYELRCTIDDDVKSEIIHVTVQ